MTQAECLSILKTGVSVFLTGEPGSGKTHIANAYVAYLRSRGVETAITASTGIAATHMGGMTIHSWSGIGIKIELTKHDLETIAKTKHLKTRVLRTRVLIIEEVSMLSAPTLSLVDAVCRKIKQSESPFGGIQVVFVGDFFQLPPIIKKEINQSPQLSLIQEVPARFAYESFVWRAMRPTVCYLTEQHRQDDTEYLAILSSIRRNIFNAGNLRVLQTRKIEYVATPKSVPKLFSHNIDVDRVNDEILLKLPSNSHVFQMTSNGPESLVAALRKSCLSPVELHLKVGAVVMFTKNNQKDGFVNGTLGIVEKFNTETGYPSVRIRNGRLIHVEPMDWSIEENTEDIVRITQLPLRLAWALTVHKSQGMSLDEAVIDLRGVFEFGQGYVALSRVRRLSGLYLLGWNSRAFQVHPEILTQDTRFRSESEITSRDFKNISSSEMTQRHDVFIHSCDGKNPDSQAKKEINKESCIKDGYSKIREKSPNAYRPWDKGQDAQLRESFLEGESMIGMTKKFSRTRGSIRARLTKLGFLPK